MVSQPDTSTSVTLRGASSVTSRPSLSRVKRYNRSHIGGTTRTPQNEFPIFSNSGDVEVHVKVGDHLNRYLLHRHTLTRCSGFFEANTAQELAHVLCLPDPRSTATHQQQSHNRSSSVSELNSMPSPPRRRWYYELDLGDGTGDMLMLVQKRDLPGLAQRSEATASSFGPGAGAMSSVSRVSSRDRSNSSSAPSRHNFLRSAINLGLATDPIVATSLNQADIDLLRDYDNMFRIFYNYPPVLNGVNIADAYVQCKSLLALADRYDALPVIGPRVDHHLLQFQSRLWKQIAKYPISYLRLGYLARSRVIFQEALIHIVGQWPAGERSLRAALPNVVLDIIEDKVDELNETVSRIEGRLFRLSLTTPRGERVTPGTSYLDWLAISMFRQWLADNTSPGENPPGPGPGPRGRRTDVQLYSALPPANSPLGEVGRAYRQVGSSNPAGYLSHDDCKRFLKLTPDLYTRDNLRRFEKRIDELKLMARDVVRPLIASSLELDLGGKAGDGISYLTCTTVGDLDLPWHLE